MASLQLPDPTLVPPGWDRELPHPSPSGHTVCGPGPQMSGIPSARDRPGWEAPAPDGFSQGHVGNQGYRWAYVRWKVPEPHKDSL